MKQETPNKVWFIAGIARGPARALAETVLEAGNSIVTAERRSIQLDDLMAIYGTRVFPLFLDVTQPFAAAAAADAAFGAFGRIDVLVNNASVGFSGVLEELTPAEFEARVADQPEDLEPVTRAALPRLKQQGFGLILQITPIAEDTWSMMCSSGLRTLEIS